MRSTFHDMAILFVISALLLVPSLAGAAVTLTYSGETPIGSGEGNQGMDTYSGPDASDSLWDYVYDLSDSGEAGPGYWGIATPVEPVAIYNIEEVEYHGDWIGSWNSCISATDYYGAFAGTALEGSSAVVWRWRHYEYDTPLTGTFHYQSEVGPVLLDWVADGDGTTYDGSGLEWSASPEPASMALSGLALLGVGFWRRRKKTA